MAGLKVSDDASYTNVAYPHPFVSGNRFESFTMKDISVCVPGMVTPYGFSSRSFNHSILASAAPSGTALPFAGMPSRYAWIIAEFPRIAFMHPTFDVPQPLASSGWLVAISCHAS